MNQVSIAQLLPSLVVATGILVSIILFWKYWHDIAFWRMNFFYNWPLIGRMSKHKNSLHQDEKSKWYDGEKKLCADYYPYYKKYLGRNSDFFENCQSYLAKAGETGRKNTPIWLWVILIPMVLAEAYMFGLVVGSFLGNLTGNQVTQTAYIFAFLLAVGLVPLTKKTGYEWYNNSLIKKIVTWRNMDRENGVAANLRPNTQVRLDNNNIDANDKDYQQILNRLNSVNAEVKPSYGYTVVTIFVLATIAIISFVERAALNQDITDQTPVAAYATFFFFSLLFLIIQLIGILAGYTWGFASKQGEEAWKYTHTFLNVGEFIEYFDSKKEFVANIAQNKLSELQTSILNERYNGAASRTVSVDGRTFLAYAKEQEQEKHNMGTNIVNEAVAVKPIETKEIICCGRSYTDSDKFCTECGKELPLNSKQCQKCGQTYQDVNVKFCSSCGGEVA